MLSEKLLENLRNEAKRLKAEDAVRKKENDKQDRERYATAPELYKEIAPTYWKQLNMDDYMQRTWAERSAGGQATTNDTPPSPHKQVKV